VEHNEIHDSMKPESFQRLEMFARAIFAVPKSEVQKLEDEEKQSKKTKKKKPTK